MVIKVNEDQFYSTYEDDIYNQNMPAILIFTKKDDPISEELMTRLNVLSNKVKLLMIQCDIEECPTMTAELVLQLDVFEHPVKNIRDHESELNDLLPYIILYEEGEIQEIFIGNEYQINTLINQIEEMEEY